MQLADREQVISEVPLGALAISGTLTLTDRRLVAVASGSEESIPLAKVASIRSAFLRDYGGAVGGRKGQGSVVRCTRSSGRPP